MKIANRTFIVSGGYGTPFYRLQNNQDNIPHRSSSGLGLATVTDLLSAGAYLSIIDRAPPPSSLSSHHVKFFKTDIKIPAEIEAAVEATVSWTKETRAHLGGVVNCAGVGTAAKVSPPNKNTIVR